MRRICELYVGLFPSPPLSPPPNPQRPTMPIQSYLPTHTDTHTPPTYRAPSCLSRPTHRTLSHIAPCSSPFRGEPLAKQSPRKRILIVQCGKMKPTPRPTMGATLHHVSKAEIKAVLNLRSGEHPNNYSKAESGQHHGRAKSKGHTCVAFPKAQYDQPTVSPD